MKDKQYVSFENYRLSREDNYPIKLSYYRLYKKVIDDFGNESWDQIWSGGEKSSGESEFTGLMARVLYYRLSTNQ